MDSQAWDERYRTGEYSPRDEPSKLLSEEIEWLPDGRALDIATGTGRNARFLAEHGYEVDAVDISAEALERARKSATERGIDVNWIQADLSDFQVQEEAYDLVHVSFYHDLNLIPELKDGLRPGGVLTFEHHLQPASLADRGPSSNRYRLRSNDLLRACLDLTVLDYRERMRAFKHSEDTVLVASIIARNGYAGGLRYPAE